MNILILAPEPFYQQRGTPIAVRMLAESLVELGHGVDLLVYHEGEDVDIPGVTLHRIKKLPLVRNVPPGPSWKKFPCDAAMLISSLGIVRRRRIDLIHAVEESAFIAVVVRALFGIPFVYDMDSSLADQTTTKWRLPGVLTRLLESLEAEAVRKSAGVVAVCEALESKARALAPGHLVRRIEDFTLLKPGATGPIIREELQTNDLIAMYVGNLEPYQGIGLLVDSFAAAIKRGIRARLVVVGGTSGHIEQYRRRAADCGVGDHMLFLGPHPLDQLHWNLQQADILISPRTEGVNTPMKIYSYLDSGRPLLATRLPTHTQVLNDDISLLADPNPESMAEALIRLADDSSLRDRLAEAARERVSAEFSPQAFHRKVAEFYTMLDKVLNSNRDSSPPAQTDGTVNGAPSRAEV